MILKFLLKRKIIKLSAQSELLVDFFLADTKVLNVEEADIFRGVGELVC